MENTIIIFLSDNGACAEDIPPHVTGEELVDLRIAKLQTRKGEEIVFGNHPDMMPGPENTYQSYGQAWANLSNTPFRFYKHWVHEGGIATPFIVHWPEGIKEKGIIKHTPAQLPDVMATIIDMTDSEYPTTYKGNDILPLEGQSMVPAIANDRWEREQPLYWEHEGNTAIRIGKWKLVRDYPRSWELYDTEKDRTEMHDLASEYPEKVAEMSEMYEGWANRCRVVPREKILDLMASVGKAFWEED